MRLVLRWLFLLSIAHIVVASPTWSQEEPGDNPFAPAEGSAVHEVPESAAASKVKQVLGNPLHDPGLEFVETPLSEVMKLIGKEYGLEIKIDEEALEDLDLTVDVPVTANVRNISLRSALKLVLKEHDLTYLVEGDQLLITSEDVALARLGVRAYSTSEPLIPFTLKVESPAGDPTPYFEASPAHRQNANIRRTLTHPLAPGGLDVDEMPLSTYVTQIREQYKIEVQLDLHGLDDLGLTPDYPLTLRIDGVSLGVALREALAQLDLAYIVRDGFLLITSEDEVLSTLSVRIYPVGDLLQPVEAGSLATMDDLIGVITATVVNEGWYDNGGLGDIRPLQPGLLVISQTEQAHEQIVELLAALRRAREHEFAIPHAPKKRKGRGETQGEKSSTPAEQSGGGVF